MSKLIPLSLMGVIMIKIFTPININSAECQKIKLESKNFIRLKSENIQSNVEQEENIEEMHNETQNIVQNVEQKVEENRSTEEDGTKNEDDSFYTTRMTSYYPSETSDCTGSGLCSWDFQVNENGWYTYQEKLVIATATDYLINRFGLGSGVHTYRYYDELVLNIDGIDYPAIVLDSCGHAMRSGRIDLFVVNASSVKDTQIIVKN